LGVHALDSIGSGINAIHSIDGTLSVRRAVPYHLAQAWFAGEDAADDLDMFNRSIIKREIGELLRTKVRLEDLLLACERTLRKPLTEVAK